MNEDSMSRAAQADGDSEYGREFWSTANAVTGFALAQNLIFYVAVGPHCGALFNAVAGQSPLVEWAIVFATAVYVGVIAFCHVARRRLSGPRTSDRLKSLLAWWLACQLALVVLLNAFAFAIVWTLPANPAACA